MGIRDSEFGVGFRVVRSCTPEAAGVQKLVGALVAEVVVVVVVVEAEVAVVVAVAVSVAVVVVVVVVVVLVILEIQ